MISVISKPEVIIEATIIRADGKMENLGIIANSKKSNKIAKFLRRVNKNG